MASESLEDAAYRHVELIVDEQDGFLHGAPVWHGWAIREAFLAGAKYAGRDSVFVRCDDCDGMKINESALRLPDGEAFCGCASVVFPLQVVTMAGMAQFSADGRTETVIS